MLINLTSQVSFVLLVSVSVVISNSNTAISCNEKDSRALQMFKQSIIDPSNRLSNWSHHQDCCAWPGVSCDDHEQGRVSWLGLRNINQKDSESLRGKINLSSLLELESLEFLDLSYNDFEGISLLPSINDDSANFSKIKKLDFSFNYHLHMDNLQWLSRLSSLQYLDLTGIDLHMQTNWVHSLVSLPFLFHLSLKDCNLTNIDKNSVNLISLSYLDLAENNFNTELPYWLFNLSNEYFRVLNLSHSNFRGQIPDWLGKFHNLLSLDLSNNLFHGSIPSNLANISIHGTLDLSFNDLSGNLPKSLIEQELDLLDLSHNSLSGDISNFSLTSSVIVMAFNNFQGRLPAILSNRVFLLDLAHNFFSESLSPLLCRTEDDFSGLVYLDISSNFLTGELPDCWNNWKYLSSIHLESNKLTGEVPPTLGSLPSLRSLDLHDNLLFGHIPWSFKYSSSLAIINLERNNFSGSLTNWMPQTISIAKLRSNQFTGNIPSQLCSLSSLTALDLAENKFSGLVPPCLNNLTSLVTGNIPNNNALTSYELSLGNGIVTYTFKIMLYTKGQQLEYSKNLRFVRSIDLSGNMLSGEIPPQLFDLIKLQSLNLSYNHLTGKVPDQIGMMKDMESLDLSHNKFHGRIPQSISSLSFLSYLNLSYNNFTGQIPLGTQLQSFDASCFIGNPELCGAPLKNCTQQEKQNQKQLDEEDGEDDNFLKSLYLGMGVGFAVGFWISSGSLFFNKAWRHTFFRFFDGVADRIYVIVALKFKNFH